MYKSWWELTEVIAVCEQNWQLDLNKTVQLMITTEREGEIISQQRKIFDSISGCKLHFTGPQWLPTSTLFKILLKPWYFKKIFGKKQKLSRTENLQMARKFAKFHIYEKNARTLKIIPRSLTEIVLSWIRLRVWFYCHGQSATPTAMAECTAWPSTGYSAATRYSAVAEFEKQHRLPSLKSHISGRIASPIDPRTKYL